jgi:single-strand DNA-binding protein
MAVVSGRLQIRGYTDKEGNKRRVAEVVAENVYFADSKKEESNGNAQSGYNNQGAYNPTGGGYSVPNENTYGGGYHDPSSDFTMLDDDDGQLPF